MCARQIEFRYEHVFRTILAYIDIYIYVQLYGDAHI